MIVSVNGLYGPFTDLCRDVCVALLRSTGKSVACIEVVAVDPGSDPNRRTLDCLGSLASSLLESADDIVVAVCRTPDAQYQAALGGSARPTLVAYEDPRYVAIFLSKIAGIDPRAAIRAVNSSCACTAGLVRTPNALVFVRDQALSDLQAFARGILAVVGLPADIEKTKLAVDIISGSLSTMPTIPSGDIQPYDALRAELEPDEALSAEGALSGYASAFNGGSLGRLIATRELFYTTEPMGGRLPATIDVTGRARWLTYGPYLSIPTGNWILRMVLAFSPEVAGLPFTVDISRSKRGVVSELGRSSFEATVGRYVVQIAFSNNEPDALVEFRLFTDKPAFDGRVSVGYAELESIQRANLMDVENAIDWKPELNRSV